MRRRSELDRKTTRRDMLRWLGLAPASLALLACDEPSARAGHDAATGDVLDARDSFTMPDEGLADTGGAVTCEPTASDLLGPYHLEGAPIRTQIAAASEPGERMTITGTVFDAGCAEPLSGVLLDVWQADATGAYHDTASDYRLRGQMLTDNAGRYALETIRPGNYPQGGSVRPAHIHFMVSRPGSAPLITQLYFSDDPWLKPNDPCGTCNSGHPSLIIDLDPGTDPDGATTWTGVFDIVLT